MTESTNCPRCGAPIPPGGSPGGLCPRCLLQAGMESKGSAAEIVYTGASDSTRKSPPTLEQLAPHFPQFEIGDLLGQGGMGAVYRARQKGLDRDVALKVLTVDAGADPTFAERFGREARTLARLAHPSIVHVYDVGQAGPWYYLVMELVEGVNLRQMMRAKTVGPRESMSIVAQMCDALQYAHDEGVVHRDIKPENVLVGKKGTVKILDFGLAKLLRRGGPDPLTKTQQVMGTPYYMAPEQWERPLEVDHRADIYSLGVVFYELLTGELPVGRFAAPSKKVEIDVRLDDVVVKTLEKEPELRYQHVSQVKTDVDRIAAGPPVLAHAVAGGVAGTATARKRKVWPWIAAAALLLLLVPLLIALLLAVRFERSSAEANAALLNLPPLVPPPSPLPPARFGFQLDRDTANSIGLDRDELERVNEALERARREYERLEAKHATVSHTSAGGLLVQVEPFPEDLRSLYSDLGQRLNLALDDPEDGAAVLQRLTRKQGLYGHEPVQIRILRKDGGYNVLEYRGNPSDPTVSTECEQLPPEYQRFWDLVTTPTPPGK
jgi:serine/threonine protein kinase